LHSIPDGESPLFFAIDGDALLTTRIIGSFGAVFSFDGEAVGCRVDLRHLSVLAFPDAGFFRSARVAGHLADVISLGPGAVRARKVLPGNENVHAVLFLANNTFGLHRHMNDLVDLRAGMIVGRNHQRAIGRFRILLRDGRNALLMVFDFMDATLML
jgi:hypothetical protein